MKPQIVTAAVLFCALLGAGGTTSAGSRPDEYQVKAALIYNALPFIQWPSGSASRSLPVCLLGEPLPAGAFHDMQNHVMMGRTIEVIDLKRDLPRPGGCDVLFIGSSEQGRIRSILDAVQGSAVLTIGDTDGYGREGVILNFYLERSRVRFEINAATARQAGITISSRLMRLAGSVHDGPRHD